MAVPADIFAHFGQNSGLIFELYQQYLVDPSLVSADWASYFSTLETDGDNALGSKSLGTPTTASAKGGPVPYAASLKSPDLEKTLSASTAGALVQVYREKGHRSARINPLSKGVEVRERPQELNPEYYGIAVDDLEKQVPSFGFSERDSVSLAELCARLEQCYCGPIGFQYSHLTRSEEREWLRAKIEGRAVRYSAERRQRIFQKLLDAEAFESNLHRKYIGKKWFSLQGGETLIPMVDALIECAAGQGVREIFFGMAHRGRLNILVNILGKSLSQVFAEFEEESVATAVGSGDVKYHLGRTHFHHSADGKTVRLELAPNPSHLEFVNPTVQGMVRARQDHEFDRDRTSVIPLVLHGDAAFIGQGVVYETINLSNLNGYTTGGTIHVVINNQVGFTTTPDEYRSSGYCTDMALGLDIPVLHVNSEDVEAAVWAGELAIEFRQKFGRDFIIDLYCYRKFGHNESDDPSFTQPQMYAEIASKKPLTALYGAELIREGVLSDERIAEAHQKYRSDFEAADTHRSVSLIGEACSTLGRLRIQSPETGVAEDLLKQIAQALTAYPASFTPHAKLKKLLDKRIESVLQSRTGIEWGVAEALAFGSLLLGGVQVRMTGQDVRRGTFSHRHLVLDDYQTPQIFSPLQALSDAMGGAQFDIHNSSLSEAGVVGFEFGYSACAPSSLVIWEAQFGDFGNGAQVFIDQFLANSEAKWDLLCGLSLFLPHGYEGQGPEHSSARLERYLQLCGEGNMVVCYPSNAAQQFHLIRRQGLMESKRPLIVMTPKSLLRLPAAGSSLDDLINGSFRTIIEDELSISDKSPHVVMMSGKVYYDVIEAIKKAGLTNVKVIRIEQLYPFPQFELKKALRDLQPRTVTWVQEEPQNMGAWSYIEPYIRGKLDSNPLYIGRPVAASTAAGSNKRHVKEQQQILSELIARLTVDVQAD
jgi:2-oxoglutarate dehydrogenase E1 component